MARITVEDCLRNCENRFALVHISAKRAHELFKGAQSLLRCKNREVVTSLREIAAKKVGFIGEDLPAEAPAKKSSRKSKD